jgi:hypothetical protein
LYIKVLYDGAMAFPIGKFVLAVAIVAVGVALAAGGIYVGDTDDAPGAAVMGIMLMIGTVAVAVRIARRA